MFRLSRVEISDAVLKSTLSVITSVTGASVQVNVRDGGAATVYAASTGGSTLSNPLASDSAGRINGWLENGPHDLVISGAGITTYTERFEAVSGASLVSVERGHVFNVEDFSPVAGSGDNTAAVQAAINAASAVDTKAIVEIPRLYTMNTPTSASGLTWLASLVADKVGLRGLGPDGGLRTDSNASLLAIQGCGKPEGIALWAKYWPVRYAGEGGTLGAPLPIRNLRPINAAAIRATSVTCTTAAHAADFAVGDYVHIRTGQVATNAVANTEPDAEYNRVKSVNVGTGVIGLERPLCKAYASENQTAVGAISSVGGGGSAAPMGIAKVTEATITDIFLEDLYLEDNPAYFRNAILANGLIWGFRMERIRARVQSLTNGLLNYTNAVFRDIENTSESAAANAVCYPVTTATGVSDVLFDNVTGISLGAAVPNVHLHEGSARVKIKRLKLRAPAVGAAGGTPVISVGGRAYDLSVDDYDIAGGPDGVGVLINSDSDGGVRIGKGRIRGPMAQPVVCNARNAIVEPPDDGLGGYVYWSRTAAPFSLGAPLPGVQRYVGLLDFANQSVELGPLPPYYLVLRAVVWVNVAFNSSGTDQIRLSTTADPTGNRLGAAVDVSAAGALFPAAGWQAHAAGAATAAAYYDNGGTEPTAGKATVVLEYITVPPDIP